MGDNSSDIKVNMDDLLASINGSFSAAQKELLGGSGIEGRMMLDSAELEVKVSIEETSESGNMKVRPISLSDIATKGIDPNLISTIRVKFIGMLNEGNETKSAPVTEPATEFKLVPNLIGMSLRKAATYLRANNWRYEVFTLGERESAVSERMTYGAVIRQKPDAGSKVSDENNLIKIWANLGNTPVNVITGIGDKLTANLAKMGIRTVGELSEVNNDELADFLKLNKERTMEYVERAKSVAQLSMLGLDDTVVELITKGAKIQSVEALSKMISPQLYKLCREAIATKKVVLTKRIVLNEKVVSKWIVTAREFLESSSD